MKKFMKAIAFVTVMCMALSTVAFAAGNAEKVEDKVLNITVTGAGTDQVALVVVAHDATNFENPLYIDQKAAAGAEGKAEFKAVLTNATVDKVDVYVGYSTYANANSKPEKIGEDVAITEPVTSITVSKVAGTEFEEKRATAGAESDYGYGYACNFAVAGAPSDVIAKQMVWAITYEDNAGNEFIKYSHSIDVSGYSICSALDGGIQLGIAFANGSRMRPDVEEVTIKSVDAIFLFSNDVEASTGDLEEFKKKFEDNE